MKRIFILIMAVAFTLCLTISVSAESSIKPLWDDTNSFMLSISYSGNSAICKLSISGASGTTKITDCNVYLKNSSGTNVSSWLGNSATGDILDFSKTSSGVSAGNTYELSFTAKVHKNGKIEDVSGSITKKYN